MDTGIRPDDDANHGETYDESACRQCPAGGAATWPGGRSTGSASSPGRSRRKGFDGLWVTDSFGRGRPTLDPIVLMSVIAALTRRIEIGTCVLQVPVRHPVELAHRIGGLHAMTGDRLMLASAAARPRPISTWSASDYDAALQER